METIWRVHQTYCWPNSFKVNRSVLWQEGDNGVSNFFPSREQAQEEADRRNNKEKHENSQGNG